MVKEHPRLVTEIVGAMSSGDQQPRHSYSGYLLELF